MCPSKLRILYIAYSSYTYRHKCGAASSRRAQAAATRSETCSLLQYGGPGNVQQCEQCADHAIADATTQRGGETGTTCCCCAAVRSALFATHINHLVTRTRALADAQLQQMCAVVASVQFKLVYMGIFQCLPRRYLQNVHYNVI